MSPPEASSAAVCVMLAAGLLTACVVANPDRSQAPVTGDDAENGVTELLQYAERIRMLPEADLRRDLDESLARQGDECGVEDVIRYALLHVVGNARFADPAAAERALEELISRTPQVDNEYIAFAAVLRDFLKVSLPVPASRTQRPLESMDRETSRDADNEVELRRLRTELDEEKARRLELERQLVELRLLEEALNDRATIEDESDQD